MANPRTFRARAWLQAARPLAQANIALPLLCGEMLAYAATGELHIGLLIAVHLLAVLDHLAIVFANDVADEAGDRLNETFTPFSGGSRVLPEGKLETASLRKAAWWMAAGLLTGAAAVGWAFDRPLLVGLWGMGLALLWAYSFAPLRLSYRGAGEAVQGLGLGVVLPLIGYYAQAGNLAELRWEALAPLFVLGAAGNISTALPDYPADLAVSKSSWPVRYGQRRARKHALQFLGLAAVATPWILPDAPRSVWIAIEAPVLVLLAWNLKHLDVADAEQRRACVQFVLVNGIATVWMLLGWSVALASSV